MELKKSADVGGDFTVVDSNKKSLDSSVSPIISKFMEYFISKSRGRINDGDFLLTKITKIILFLYIKAFKTPKSNVFGT